MIEKAFKANGLPTRYIAGAEISGAVVVGLRYGKGELYMKRRAPERVFWQGPSAELDFGSNGSRVFTLCYNLQSPEYIYRRFPGAEGSIYFVAGLGLNYQRAGAVTWLPSARVWAPERTGSAAIWTTVASATQALFEFNSQGAAIHGRWRRLLTLCLVFGQP